MLLWVVDPEELHRGIALPPCAANDLSEVDVVFIDFLDHFSYVSKRLLI